MSFFVSESIKEKIKIEEDEKVDYDEIYFSTGNAEFVLLNFSIYKNKFKFEIKANKKHILTFFNGIDSGKINLGADIIKLNNIKLKHVESILESNMQNKYILTLYSVVEEHNV